MSPPRSERRFSRSRHNPCGRTFRQPTALFGFGPSKKTEQALPRKSPEPKTNAPRPQSPTCAMRPSLHRSSASGKPSAAASPRKSQTHATRLLTSAASFPRSPATRSGRPSRSRPSARPAVDRPKGVLQAWVACRRHRMPRVRCSRSDPACFGDHAVVVVHVEQHAPLLEAINQFRLVNGDMPTATVCATVSAFVLSRPSPSASAVIGATTGV